MRGPKNRIWLLVLLLGLAGCAQFRLPAIDPSGERIFLPHPNYTTVNSPANCFPKPAFETPDIPPPCPVDPNAPLKPKKRLTHKEFFHPGKAGELFVSPKRLLAPVGGEVVLKSGIIGPSGRPVANQPIEWMLSSDSVGQFVQVGQNGHKLIPNLIHEKSKKHSGTYVVSRTLKHTRRVTRGTKNHVDDVHVERGQCWTSLTSATEGTSHITVVAPNAENWDRRRRTVTVHWVDVAPIFPDHQVLQTGQVTTLRTTVARNNGQPLSNGWLVRYEVIEGDATFTGSKQADVTPGADGVAPVQVSTTAADASKSVIEVKVIRLGQTPSDPPQLVVSREKVNVTWSTSALKVNVLGPESAPLGDTVTYRIQVTNAGDLPARQVTLKHTLPMRMKFLNANPNPMGDFTKVLSWDLGDIASNATREIEVNCRTDLEGSVRNEVVAQSKTQKVTADATTRFFRQSLKLTMSGPETAEVGEKVTFVIQVTNGSNEAMANVQFKDNFDGGLVHSDLQASPVKFSLGSIGVGETVEKALTFIVKEPGIRTHTLHVTTEDGQKASATGRLQASASAVLPVKAGLAVQKNGPRSATVGSTIHYTIEVQNTGTKPLRNIQVVDQYAKQIKPTLATDGFDPSEMAQRKLSWYIPVLAGGQKRTFKVRCTCTGPGRAENKVRVQSGSGLKVDEVAITHVKIKGPTETVSGVAESGSGTWKVEVADLNDAIRVGGTTTYHIDLTNDRDKQDRDVMLEIKLSEGLQYVGSNQTGLQVSSDKRTIQYGPIREVRPREKLPTLRIQAKGTKSGEQSVTVTVTSREVVSGVTTNEKTTVYVE